MKARDILLEGGNVQIGSHEAERIDLTKLNRSNIVPLLDAQLKAIDASYHQQFKQPLWGAKLLANKQFLSGSAFHFFDQNIPDTEFVRVKPTVGDIDTQVNKDLQANVEQWLQAHTGHKIGHATLLGHKASAGQLITLWEFVNPPIKVQIDLEMVDYAGGSPTEWAQFSHSSDWQDLSAGVKGVFHKYLMRAFTTNTLKDRAIQMKSGKIKPMTSTDIAFSVASGQGGGMRQKYQPVIDPATGQQKSADGLPLYTEIPTATSTYVQDLPTMFNMIFGRKPKGKEADLLKSFTGGVQLANKYCDEQAKAKIINGFMLTLYGPQAQELYKGDPQKDYQEKSLAMQLLVKGLGMTQYMLTLKPELERLVKDFYARYKQPQQVSETVQASARQGIEHLQKMNDLEFIKFARSIKDEFNGLLNPIKMTVKVDGLGARFGKDAQGRPFFESSHSGPIFVDGAFTAHAQSKGFTGEKLERAAHYDQIYRIIVTSKFVQALPNDTKVNCELLYNPMAEATDEGLKFVTVSYDKRKLGRLMTIVPFDSYVASTGEKRRDSDKIKDYLVSLGEVDGIKFVDDRLGFAGDINVSAHIDPLLSVVNDQFIATLTSRTRAAAEDKAKLKAFIQSVKDELADYIIKHPDILGKTPLGQGLEGVILHRRDASPIKVTTPDFKQQMKNKLQKSGV